MSIIFMLFVLFFPQAQAQTEGVDSYQSGAEYRATLRDYTIQPPRVYSELADCHFWAGFFDIHAVEYGCVVFLKNNIKILNYNP